VVRRLWWAQARSPRSQRWRLQVLEDFEKLVGDTWKTAAADGTTGNAIVEAAIKEYQDPANADKLLKVQRELDDTKVVLVRVRMCSIRSPPVAPFLTQTHRRRMGGVELGCVRLLSSAIGVWTITQR
jgi:hypothetical protein